MRHVWRNPGLKWLGGALLLALLIAWLASAFVMVNWRAGRFGIAIVRGAVLFVWGGPSSAWSGPSIYRLPWPGFFKWLPYHWAALGQECVGIPLWIPIILAALPTAFLLWRDRRRRPEGHCRKCGHNLTGNVSGVCPECGEKV